MDYAYHVGECPVCKSFGLMEVHYSFKNSQCTIACEECLLEFDTLSDYLESKNGYRKSYKKAEARLATLEEIKDSEWYPYLMEV